MNPSKEKRTIKEEPKEESIDVDEEIMDFTNIEVEDYE